MFVVFVGDVFVVMVDLCEIGEVVVVVFDDECVEYCFIGFEVIMFV